MLSGEIALENNHYYYYLLLCSVLLHLELYFLQQNIHSSTLQLVSAAVTPLAYLKAFYIFEGILDII